MNASALLEQHGLSNLVEAATALATFSHLCSGGASTIPDTVVTHLPPQQQQYLSGNNAVYSGNLFQSPSATNLFIRTPTSTPNVNSPSIMATPANAVQTDNTNSNNKETFPERLMTILNDEVNVSPDVISWLPNGRSFIIARPDIFMESILPQYIKPEANTTPSPPLTPGISTKYPSFTRKLNRWGFRQITRGPETGAFHHPLFRRDKPELCLEMFCQRNSKKEPKKNAEKTPEKQRTKITSDKKMKKRRVSMLTKESLEVMNKEQEQNGFSVITTSNLQTVVKDNIKPVAATVSEDSQSMRSSTSGSGNNNVIETIGSSRSVPSRGGSTIVNNPELVQRAITKRNEEERMRLAKVMLYNSFLQAMNGEDL